MSNPEPPRPAWPRAARGYVAGKWRGSPLQALLWRAHRLLNPPGRCVPRPADGTDRCAAVPFAYDLSSASPPSGGIGVVCHLFYDDLAADMRRTLENIPFPADVFVSTDTEAKRGVIRAAFEGWSKGRVEVRIAENRGRDIGPKLVTFRDVYDRYELVLFLHGKRTVTKSIGNAWRETLTRSLVGSPDTVRSIVDVFARHPDIGIVMCEHFEPIRSLLNWGEDFPHARRLARRMGMGLTPRHVLDFPSGSMFWLRPGAIRPLLDLGLTFADFPEEAGQEDGTIQHAIERLVLFVCEHAGFRWVKVADPACFQDQSGIVPIAGPSGLARFVEATRFNLLASA